MEKAVALFFLLSVLLSSGELAAAESSCKMTEQGMIACLPSMADGKSPAAPSPKCCAALAKADLPCLCKYKDSPALRQLGINPKLAVQLPVKCKLSSHPAC
ncbi:putative lipid-transfer protein DIR1 [Zingiber officinale]|uniref:Bifunctional inhibitor/plant lipid transfer protein/seed storage helical domain-containing protein n=1 Tax=Zingiber officinale TaxID=94328 RepID=A0A8J5C429_ZINOF|nr:putative lipid-transfer protein DIR1 [Zingiber officinale]KAG6471940.1 hypothetical protein ZIOFF_069393 [Zingiber officinale]